MDAIERLPQPVIAAVQGHCYTGALELAIACDLLVAADTAKFSDTHGKWGMSPTWGMSQRLPRRVGLLAAKEMMFSGRVIGGEEAVAWVWPTSVLLKMRCWRKHWPWPKASSQFLVYSACRQNAYQRRLRQYTSRGFGLGTSEQSGPRPDMAERLASV
ncbi:MAG: hypothetical protein CM15mP120_08570 [Pseudomonadota bacterium]|nr:MAG: hypothetical protein CM15mP120_08570 [Pseudomonadota bacterium]